MKTILILLSCLPLWATDYSHLLALAEKWEVPQPQPRSKLVKIWTYYNSSGEYYRLGFVEPDKPGKALVGAAWEDIRVPSSSPPILVPKIADLSLEFIVTSSPFGEPNEPNSGLITAIQLIRYGYPEVGEKLLEKALKSDAGHSHSPFRIQSGQPADLMLAQSCLAAATNLITSPNPDFKTIKRRIETLIADRPTLKSKTTDWLLDALTASVNHPKPEPDTLEALIDEFLLSGGTHGAMSFGDHSHLSRKELVLRGFSAIPALIKHLDDKRMTNHLTQGFNNFSSFPMTADLVISNYLQSFANNEMGANWLLRQKGHATPKDVALNWWKTASAMGEREYARRYILRMDEEKKVHLSEDLLTIAEARYPDLIPPVYTAILKTKHQSHDVAEALSGHPRIPLEVQKRLLLKAIASGKEAHRNSALHEMLNLDSKEGEEILLRLIKKGPKTTRGEYWLDQNAGLTRFVSQSTHLGVWKATEKYLSRASLGMRMELLHNLSPPVDAPMEVLNVFFRIFDQYQTAKTLRKNSLSRKFDGPGAGFPYEILELRNFVHMHYGRWLEVEAEPPEREVQTPAQWEAFRSEVVRAVLAFRSERNLLPRKR